MRAVVLIAALLSSALVAQGRAESDPIDRFATLDAALVLARLGRAEGDADMMLAALEVIADLGPAGAADWIETIRQETIFAALGNQDLIARAQAVQWAAGSQDLHLIPPATQYQPPAFPSDHHVGRARGPSGWTLTSPDSGRSCALQTAAWMDCSAVTLSGSVTLIPSDLTLPAPVAFEIIESGDEARK